MMKFTVRVKAGASQEKVEKVSDTEYAVWVRQVPEKAKPMKRSWGAGEVSGCGQVTSTDWGGDE